MEAEFHKGNRQRLALSLDGSVFVATAYYKLQSSNDAAHDFIQEANFLWLTGIEESGWRLVIDGARGKSILVSPEMSEMARIFDGGLTDESALRLSGADEVITSDQFESYLRNVARKHTVVYTIKDVSNHDFVLNPALEDLHSVLSRIFTSVLPCNDVLARFRAIKQPAEIAAIKKAIVTTIHGFEKVKQSINDISFEYEVEAILGYEFRKKNAKHAYAPIVAAGRNACTLHYAKNESRIRANELVLIDVGARVNGYAADVTRTYLKGTGSRRRREVHQAVEAAHHDIVAMIKPGLAVKDYLSAVDTRMKQALREVGLIQDMHDDKAYRRYFPHAISHGLGIDVHDSLGKPEVFQENMVLTVEPGIYVPDEGIGVRIEDDILITSNGSKNLSGALSTGM
jgi:Xaa-Pro aminopeptidase